jgi:hypothetical protein
MQMTKFVQFGLAAMALGAFALVSGTQAEAKCWRKSASGVGISQELAKGTSKVALDFEIAAAGATGRGRTWYRCMGDVFAECKASQMACK